MKVHESINYDLFKFLDGNRKINKAHKANIQKSIELNGLLETILIVNGNMEIIDGQHRFEVLRELKLPIKYVIKQSYGLREVHVYNQNSKNWTLEQFMISYSDMGMKEYQIYKHFKQKYNFGHNETIAMLTDKINYNGKAVDKFKAGKFKVKNLSGAHEIAEKIYKFAPYYEGFRRRSFVLAMLKILRRIDRYDHDQMINKISFQSAKLQDQTTSDEYIPILEKIYNYKIRDNFLRFDIRQ